MYAASLAADRESQLRFAGHGSAIAQTYNHAILPLSNRRDKVTQVLWGIRDFARRFGRRPEGMWLPETAVDVETLDILAEHGITYTILAQRQAARMRRIGDTEWRSVSGGHVDPTMPYVALLPSGRTIIIIFYDGPISQALAFAKLLERSERHPSRLPRFAPLADHLSHARGSFEGASNARRPMSTRSDPSLAKHHTHQATTAFEVLPLNHGRS